MRQQARVFTSFLVAASLTIPLSAQQGDSFAERVDVNIVTVDVLISDRQGKPATGLDKSAFQLKEDKNKIKIDRFSEDGTAAATFASVVIYVDDTHLYAAGRDAALDALSPYFTERMASGESAVMVVRFDGFSEILQSFTTDIEAVRSAIEDLKQRETNPSESMLLEREAVRQMQERCDDKKGRRWGRRPFSQGTFLNRPINCRWAASEWRHRHFEVPRR